MEVSENGIKLIKTFEGCRLKAYKCPAGIPTIGYGHTHNVNMNDTITQEQAEAFLRHDLKIHGDNILKLVKVSLNQNQFDSLVSFEYNVGYGNFARSTMLKMINARKFKDAANQFDKWIYANKKILTGLVKRRKAEKELFLK